MGGVNGYWPSNNLRRTKTHYNRVESLKFAHDWQQVVLQEYIDAVKAATQRVVDITAQMERSAASMVTGANRVFISHLTWYQ